MQIDQAVQSFASSLGSILVIAAAISLGVVGLVLVLKARARASVNASPLAEPDRPLFAGAGFVLVLAVTIFILAMIGGVR